MKAPLRQTFVRCSVAALLAGAAAGGAFAQGSCTCEDVLDLQGRYCAAGGAIQEWDRLLRWTDSKVEKRESVELFDGSNKGEVELCVDEAMGMYYARFTGNRSETKVQLRGGRGKTDESCKVSVDAPTACLREVLANHEQLHRRTCEARTAPDAKQDDDLSFVRQLFARYANWRYGRSLMSYMLEERAAYGNEMGDLQDRLQKLSERCPGFFERQSAGKRSFSLTPCPRPDPEAWRKDRKCKRL